MLRSVLDGGVASVRGTPTGRETAAACGHRLPVRQDSVKAL